MWQIVNSNWAVKITGSRYDLDHIGNIPIITAQGEVLLKEVADVIQSREPARELVRFNNNPSILRFTGCGHQSGNAG